LRGQMAGGDDRTEKGGRQGGADSSNAAHAAILRGEALNFKPGKSQTGQTSNRALGIWRCARNC
jgi:hypothetical protein